nr:hypothetical protein [Tanacetum cinerariifolium]
MGREHRCIDIDGKAKAALCTVIVCVNDVGCCDDVVIVKTLVNLMVEFMVSDDWCVRKGDLDVLEKWVRIADVKLKRKGDPDVLEKWVRIADVKLKR